jgi:hypothetical protein
MLLKEIINEAVFSADMAIDQLISNTNSLAALYSGTLTNQVEKLYAEGLHDDMKRTVNTVTNRTRARWFLDNYLSTSTRRTSPIQGLKESLLALAKLPRYQSISSSLNELGSFKMTAYASGALSNPSEGVSYSGYVKQLETDLPLLLKKLSKIDINNSDRFSIVAERLYTSIHKFYVKLKKLHEDWESNWGKSSAEKKPEKDKRSFGQQYTQVEEIINNVLSNLSDRRQADDIRRILARSDNKLLTLQQELNKRGLQ